MEKEKSIYLRLMTAEDTDRIIKWRNTDFVRRNFIYREPFTRKVHEKWIADKVATGKVVQFIICEKKTDRPVGSVYLRDIDRQHNKAEYGIFIGEEDALSKGYGTQAAKLVLAYAFEELQLHKVMLRLLALNKRAEKSYEKAGFVKEAYLREEVFLEGSYQDVILMAILKEDWRRLREKND